MFSRRMNKKELKNPASVPQSLGAADASGCSSLFQGYSINNEKKKKKATAKIHCLVVKISSG